MSDDIKRCPHPVGWIRDIETQELIPCPCNRLDCPVCGVRRKGRLVADVNYGADVLSRGGRRWRALTLTSSPDTPQDKMPLYWARFRAYLANHGIRDYQYFKVTEFTKSGLRHFHIAISAFIPFNLIQAAWRAATEGTAWRVHIEQAQLRSVAGYFLKYITKSLQHEHRFNKGERRYTFSKNFPRLPKPVKVPGKYVFLSFVDYMYECLANGTWYENDRIEPKIPANPWWNVT